jgi:hypothetical protein
MRSAKARTQARTAARKRASVKTPPVRPVAPRQGAKQAFTVSHLGEEDFVLGLRRYAQYRDLGMAKATGGMVQAHVIRFVPPCEPREVAKLHYHDVAFQMVYVLKGWISTVKKGCLL